MNKRATIASLARWLAAAGIVAGGVYAAAAWDSGAAWVLVILILLGVLIAHPTLLDDFTATVTGILGT